MNIDYLREWDTRSRIIWENGNSSVEGTLSLILCGILYVYVIFSQLIFVFLSISAAILCMYVVSHWQSILISPRHSFNWLCIRYTTSRLHWLRTKSCKGSKEVVLFVVIIVYLTMPMFLKRSNFSQQWVSLISQTCNRML